MKRVFLTVLFLLSARILLPQEITLGKFIADSTMTHASVSFYVADASSGEPVLDFNSSKSLTPASVMKLVTSAVTLELLGPGYTFKTQVGYSGTLDTLSGILTGNIIIRGGGDPALGSSNFAEHYGDFISIWSGELKKTGIKSVNGRVISDDSYYDYQPVPSKWLWEDSGNYYGAGVFGLSVFDNLYEIHLRSSSGISGTIIKETVPEECGYELINRLTASGTSDEGYVFASPYSTSGWIEGSIPAGKDDFVIKASIPDPPLLLSRILTNKLKSEGIPISQEPSTVRTEKNKLPDDFTLVAETDSPPLSDILKVLNHESINLYAEHLVKELGKRIAGEGSTAAGVSVIYKFLHDAGIKSDGLFMEDGSGLSPLDAINSKFLADFLIYIKNKGKYFSEYLASLPDPGKTGTLKYHFLDPVFNSRLKAKSGSMTRVRSYAGYLTTLKNNKLVFCILVNNYMGPPNYIVSQTENILKQIITNK